MRDIMHGAHLCAGGLCKRTVVNVGVEKGCDESLGR